MLLIELFLGQYYNYDSSSSAYHDSIMSDQLAGFWYLRLTGHKYEVNLNYISLMKDQLKLSILSGL